MKKVDYLSENTRSITPYTAGEQPQDRRYIKLNTNENPYPPSPKTAEFLEGTDVADLRLYPDPNASGLCRAIAKAKDVCPENVFVGNGSDEVLAHCFKAYFDPNADDVAFADVTYSFYPVYAALFGIRTRILPLDEQFRLRTEDYIGLQGVQGIVIANPNAPTGIGVPLSEIERIVAENRDKVVVVDEAYVDFYGVSAVPLVKKYRNLVVVQTFSKSYSLAGIRCGFAVADEYLISGLNRVKDSFNSYPLDRLCQGVCTAAVTDAAYYRGVTAQVVETRERTVTELRALGFEVLPSQANFFFMRCPGKEGGELYRRLKDNGILVRHFAKPRISDYLRVTVGTPEDMEKFTEFVKKICK